MEGTIDFRALAEHIPTLCWIAAPDGHINWYNRRWYEYTGSTPTEMEGWGWQSVHDPLELPKVLERWRSAIASGRSFEMTFPLRDATGRFRPFLTRIVPSRDETGAVSAWYGVNTDVSEQIHAEQALRRAQAALRDLNAGLEREVEARTHEANEAREQAEAANRAKSDFLASMSHEIRTPLHGVLGYAEMLRGSGLTAQQDRQLERLQSSGASLLTIVNDVLDYTKIEAGRFELNNHPFATAGLIDNALSIVRASAEAKGLALVATLDPDLPDGLIGDQDRLRQVLLNLLANAIKFTASGSVALEVTVRPSDAAPNRCEMVFAVKDTGIGISQDKLHRLFERFSQVDSSIGRRYGGTGLGLAISRTLVELMGGTLTVESAERRGSTFRVALSLPIAGRIEMPAATPIALPVMPNAARLRILVAEDVEVNQEIIRAVLEREHHVVDIVSDGAGAVRAVQSEDYDLVLMDVQMPGMDGIQATGQIRKLAHRASRLPIIAMTANVLPQQVAQFRAAGMDDHVGKPFKREELYATIARWAHRDTRAAPS